MSLASCCEAVAEAVPFALIAALRTRAGSSAPDRAPRRSPNLGTFLHLHDLVGHEAVSLAMHSLRSLLIRGLDEAEHLSRLFVEPVLAVGHAALLLDLEVALLGSRHRLRGQVPDVLWWSMKSGMSGPLVRN